MLSDPRIQHSYVGMDIDTDVLDFPEYFVYIVARGDDGDGEDVWFVCSPDMGVAS